MQTKKNKDIIYGQRSINAQIPGMLTRQTSDYDIYTKNPKKAAMKIEKKFDNIVQSNQFYTKPALHPGTYKVMHYGQDQIQKTKDDVGVIDYTNIPKPKPGIKIVNGIRYRNLAGEAKAKRKALRDKAFSFRHKKDMQGLNSIKLYRRYFK